MGSISASFRKVTTLLAVSGGIRSELDSVGGYVQIAAPEMILLQPLVNALRFSASSNRQK